MILLIEDGELFAPAPQGRSSVLIVNDRIVHVGPVDRTALDQLHLEYDVIQARGDIIAPGLIDPHQHLLGGSGEQGLSTQTPGLFVSEIVAWGITTVVGVLGVDTTMKTMAGLLARVKGLREEGLSTRIWTGGYNVPPTTILGSVREDILFIDECIGAGEIAISDERSLGASTHELAKLIFDTHVGGMLAGKAGLTHLHVGEASSRLRPLRDVLDQHAICPEWLYPTHVQRTEQLLDEAIALQHTGMTLDFDTSAQNFVHWFRYFLDHGGDPTRLTISSDSDSGTPAWHFEAICSAVVEHGFPLEQILALATENVANVLQLPEKGRIRVDGDADVLVLERGSLAIREVIARGRRMVVDGRVMAREGFLKKSGRAFALVGEQAPPSAIHAMRHRRASPL